MNGIQAYKFTCIDTQHFTRKLSKFKNYVRFPVLFPENVNISK